MDEVKTSVIMVTAVIMHLLKVSVSDNIELFIIAVSVSSLSMK